MNTTKEPSLGELTDAELIAGLIRIADYTDLPLGNSNRLLLREAADRIEECARANTPEHNQEDGDAAR